MEELRHCPLPENLMSASSRKRAFFAELESTRGLAALFVAGYHCSGVPVIIAGAQKRLSDNPEATLFWQAVRELFHLIVCGTGQIHHGVLFFFILSGFVLTDSLEKGPASVARAGSRFTLARLFRIFPAISAALFLFWLTNALTGLNPNDYSSGSLVRNALLFETNIIGAAWTLQVELVAIALIFVAFLIKFRWGLAGVGILAVTLAVLSFWGRWEKLWFDPPSKTVWLYMFLFGVVAYHLGRKFAPGMNRARATGVFFTSTLVFFTVGLVIHNKWHMVFQTIAGSVLVAVLAFGPSVSATAVLRARPVRFLGRVSYSFYLLHPLTLGFIRQDPDQIGSWIEKGIPPVLISISLWVATSAAILPVAWLMHRTVEMPCVQVGKWLWSQASGRGSSGHRVAGQATSPAPQSGS